MTKTTDDSKTDLGWCILELLGHRRLGGYVTEATIAGAAFLRIDVPGDPPATQFYSASAVYAITPTTEEMARKVAGLARPSPVQRWELAAPEALPAPSDDFDYLDDDDEGSDISF